MIRQANPNDAASIHAIKKNIMASQLTSKLFITTLEELPDDLETEKRRIRTGNQDGNLTIVFEQEREVVGFLLYTRYAPKRLQHAGSMGMGVSGAYADKGIGTKLIQHLLDWAKDQPGLEKICLGVVSINDRAIHLYSRMGFTEEGRQKNQVKFEDGTYGDDVLMAYYLR